MYVTLGFSQLYSGSSSLNKALHVNGKMSFQISEIQEMAVIFALVIKDIKYRERLNFICMQRIDRKYLVLIKHGLFQK